MNHEEMYRDAGELSIFRYSLCRCAGAGMASEDGHDEDGERDVNDERRRGYRERDDHRD
ncbi:MAG: hypothetical protein WGN25_05415 [Candidatus Electrothrix sp. GW3-4]|uniref:hypothetical protein n=1 Tax=Candidatus Electrothrix sp. GW3-4 TaxID=3126740 RepID=UPI0030CC6192